MLAKKNLININRRISMDRLDILEAQSIYILREAYKKLGKLGMLWSIGKDSTVLLWLSKKAFFGHCPFPFIHIDTTYKIPEMIEYRDKVAKELNLDLIVHTNKEAIANGMGPEHGRFVCCKSLKTEGLQQVVKTYKFDGLIVGVRRDEEGSRSKERVFSERNKNDEWDYTNQQPELWDQFKTDFPKGNHIRVHPLLAWNELDIWEANYYSSCWNSNRWDIVCRHGFVTYDVSTIYYRFKKFYGRWIFRDNIKKPFPSRLLYISRINCRIDIKL